MSTEVLHAEQTEEHAPRLDAHVLGNIGPFPITDAHVGGFFVIGIIVIGALFARRTFGIIPTRIQVIFETAMDFILDTIEDATGSREKARALLPLIFTLVLFIGIANQLVLFPFLFQITWDGVLLVRQPTTSLSATIALAVIVIGSAHILALRISPVHHILRFFPIHRIREIRGISDVLMVIIDLFVGFLELIGEMAKTASLAARLFGNLFAGMVVSEIVRALVPFVAPIPFAGIEMFAGSIQVFVFMLLSIQFITSTIAHAQPHHEDDEELLNYIEQDAPVHV